MIKGKRKLELTPATILNMISDFDIYMMYMPDRHWKVNQSTTSPFHKDLVPSFLIGNREGYLYHIDFSNTLYRGGCFDFVCQRFNLSLNEALIKIDNDFSLGIYSNTERNYKEITSQYKQPESIGKRYSIIQCVTRKFTKEELEYWEGYYQTEEDLRRDHVHSLKEVYLNKKRYPIGVNELRFGYFEENGGFWKIYRPTADKKHKWISNVPLTRAYGLENLCLGHNTLVTKSRKDYMLCRKLYPYTCHVQNESIFAFSDETREYINTHSKGVYLGYDSDESGKAASYIVTNAFGWKHINTPDRLLPAINDFADWGKAEGLEVVKRHFIEKGLI